MVAVRLLRSVSVILNETSEAVPTLSWDVLIKSSPGKQGNENQWRQCFGEVKKNNTNSFYSNISAGKLMLNLKYYYIIMKI